MHCVEKNDTEETDRIQWKRLPISSSAWSRGKHETDDEREEVKTERIERGEGREELPER